jgi:hypothetical protein
MGQDLSVDEAFDMIALVDPGGSGEIGALSIHQVFAQVPDPS